VGKLPAGQREISERLARDGQLVSRASLLEVVDSHDEDDDAVDRAAERLGVERGVMMGLDAGQLLRDRLVEHLDPVVPQLIELVDPPLGSGYLGVASALLADQVLSVPQLEVVSACWQKMTRKPSPGLLSG
jgi:hypothetical protein